MLTQICCKSAPPIEQKRYMAALITALPNGLAAWHLMLQAIVH